MAKKKQTLLLTFLYFVDYDIGNNILYSDAYKTAYVTHVNVVMICAGVHCLIGGDRAIRKPYLLF